MPSNNSRLSFISRIIFGASALAVILVGPAGIANLAPQVSVHSETTNESWSKSPESTDEVSLSLTSSGFQPQQVQHSAGTFAIAVNNTIHSGAYTIRLKAAGGTLLKEVQVQKGSAAFTVELAAGTYTLSDSSNPEWTCNLTIQ